MRFIDVIVWLGLFRRCVRGYWRHVKRQMSVLTGFSLDASHDYDLTFARSIITFVRRDIKMKYSYPVNLEPIEGERVFVHFPDVPER